MSADLEFVERTPRPLVIETLEPRVLFSGAPVAAPAPEAAPVAQAAPSLAPAQEAVAAVEAEDAVAAAPVVAAAPEPTVEISAPQEAVEGDIVLPEAGGDGTTAFALTDTEVAAIAEAATERWIESGITQDQADALASVNYQIADLEGNRIGSTEGTTITIDIDAAGRNWFVDATPLENEEFFLNGSALRALEGSEAQGRIDLLTTILHEQGHILGISDGATGELMFEFLGEGERRLPSDGLAEGSEPLSLGEDSYLTVLGFQRRGAPRGGSDRP